MKQNDKKSNLNTKDFKVIEVNSKTFTLSNEDVYEHQFEISDDITIEEFQKLLDESKKLLLLLLDKIGDYE